MTILGSARVSAIALLTTFAAINVFAADVIPPKPPGYFQDNAGVVSKEAALRFNEQLAQFERETSNQVWVVIYPKMQSDSDAADYAQRIAQAWGVGSNGRDNGVVMLVFVADRKVSIQVGYGLEGTLPDATTFDIREYHINPHFKTGDYEGGLAEGIDSIFKAIRGEYVGSGKTALEQRGQANAGRNQFISFLVFLVILIVLSRIVRRLGGYGYSSRGGPVFFPTGGGWSGGGGGGWSSGGGGFSGSLGGGGSFGGGGSTGSW